MKGICRILSVFATLSILVVGGILLTKALNKPKDNTVYATHISFETLAGSVELYINNNLVLDNNLIKVEPSNCSFSPEITIKKQGEGEECLIIGTKHSFNSIGKYVLTCKIRSSKNYYIQDN